MSWHLEVCGTKEDVVASIEECVAQSNGMPESVGAYLKDAVSACKTDSPTPLLVHVKSNGHRPMESSQPQEEAIVRVLRSGPWKPGP